MTRLVNSSTTIELVDVGLCLSTGLDPGLYQCYVRTTPITGVVSGDRHRCTKGMQRLLTASCVSCTVYEVARTALFQYPQPGLTELEHVLAARA